MEGATEGHLKSSSYKVAGPFHMPDWRGGALGRAWLTMGL